MASKPRCGRREGLCRGSLEVDVVELQKSPQAAPGSCVLESEYGRVDASLATQLAAVRMGLIKAFVGRRDGVAPKQEGSA